MPGGRKAPRVCFIPGAPAVPEGQCMRRIRCHPAAASHPACRDAPVGRLGGGGVVSRIILLLAAVFFRDVSGGDCLHTSVASKFTGSVVRRRVSLAADTVSNRGFWIHQAYLGANYSCTYPGELVDNPLGTGKATCSESDVQANLDNDALRTLLDQTLPSATRVIGDTFSVRPTSPQLNLWDPSGASAGGMWVGGAPDTCGHINLKDSWVQEALNTVAGSALLPTRADDSTLGVDMILLVTLLPQPEASRHTASWGGVCAVDMDAGLPRLAFLNINPAFLGRRRVHEVYQLEKSLLHDLLHIMGFSSMYWNTPWGADRSPLVRDMAETLAFARRHLACDSIGSGDAFLLLEDSEVSAVSSHWEKRLFNTEVMSQIDTDLDLGNPLPLSGLTLGYFQSLSNGTDSPLPSGYVTIYDTHVQDLAWGKGKGCDFFRECSSLAGNDTYLEFCNPLATGSAASPEVRKNTGRFKYQCTFTGGAKGVCNAEVLSPTPAPFSDIFDLAKYGSYNAELNYCPVVRPHKVCSDETALPQRDYTIEHYGIGGRCVDSDDYGAVCVRTCCGQSYYFGKRKWMLYITVPTSQASGWTTEETLRCSGDGSAANITTTAWGQVLCPDANTMCGAISAQDSSSTTALRRISIRPAGPLTSAEVASGYTPADRSVLSYPGVTLLFEMEFTVALEGDFNISVQFPTAKGWSHGNGDVAIELVSPGYSGSGSGVSASSVLSGVWFEGLLTVSSSDLSNYNYRIYPCDVLVFRASNFTSPPGFGEESIDPTGYRVVVSTNGTSYHAGYVDPLGDSLPYPNTTETESVTHYPTATASLTETETPTDSLTESLTYTSSPTVIPPTATRPFSKTTTISLTERPSLPCFCYGRGNCQEDLSIRSFRCLCDEGFSGKFCQLETCSKRTCGRWGTCFTGIANTSTEEMHITGSQGFGNPLYEPHRWMVEVARFPPRFPHALRGTPYGDDDTDESQPPSAGAPPPPTFPEASLTPEADSGRSSEQPGEVLTQASQEADHLTLVSEGHLGVNLFGWYKLCPDTEWLREVRLGGVTFDDIRGGFFEGEPYHCVPLGDALTQVSHGGDSGAGPRHRRWGLVSLGETTYNVTSSWVTPGVFALSVNQTGFSEEDADELLFDPSERTAIRTDIHHTPYTGEGSVKARLLWAADYASDERTEHTAPNIPVGLEADARRLDEDDPFFVAYGASERFSTPYLRQLSVSHNRDTAAVHAPSVSYTVVPGSVLEWVASPPDFETSESKRISEQGDRQISLSAPLWSQHLVVVFGAGGRAEDTAAYAMQLLYSIPEFSCECASNSTEGPVWSDMGDPVCHACAPSAAGLSPAYPPGDCTQPCRCFSGGVCDASGACDCPQNFTGAMCEFCVASHYPDTTCDRYCDAEVTCLGRGQCNGYGDCICRSGFAGASCERRDCRTPEVQCNSLGTCYNQESPSELFRHAFLYGLGDPRLWADPPGETFSRSHDWNEDSHAWHDGGEDTFDAWGLFEICSGEAGCRPLLGVHREGGVAPQAVRHGSTTGVVWSGWLNGAVFILTLEVDAGPGAWLQFGGRYGSPFVARDTEDEVAFRGTEVSIRMRHVTLIGKRQSVVYGIGRPSGKSRLFSDTILHATKVDSTSEVLRTPTLQAGDGAPVAVFVHWGLVTSERLRQSSEMAGFATSSVTTAYCVGCGVRGGMWCDRCSIKAFPKPRLLTYPPAAASSGFDKEACSQTCGCVGIDKDEPCSENGVCQCTGKRSGMFCQKCLPEYYPWPSCATYCHSLFTCSGKGVCDSDGKCKCFAGYRGFSCQRRACESASCGADWNAGHSLCSSPSNAGYRLLWQLGTPDGSSREFTKPALRKVFHPALQLTAQSLPQDMPGSIAGPDVTPDELLKGLGPSEFSPMSVSFYLPQANVTGHCWRVPDLGPGYYDYNVTTESTCVSTGGRWDSTELCYIPQVNAFRFVSVCPLPLQRVFSSGSRFSVTFLFTNPSGRPVTVNYYINNRLAGTLDEISLAVGVELPFSWLRWGAWNKVTAKVEQGGELAVDYIVMDAVTNIMANASGMSSYYLQPQSEINADLLSLGMLDPTFFAKFDIIQEASSSRHYLAEGTGLRYVNSTYVPVSTFNRYGFFQVCLLRIPECKSLFISGGTKQQSWPLFMGGVLWEVASEYVHGVSVVHVRQRSGLESPEKFYLLFGGHYANSSVPRAYDTSQRLFVINNYPVLGNILATYEGAIDEFSTGAPQMHAVFLSPGSTVENPVSVTVEQTHLRDYLGRGNYTTEERVRVDNVQSSLSMVLQWGFSTRMQLLRHVFAAFGREEPLTCSCMSAFTGTNCDRCKSVNCSVPQCYDEQQCSTCTYPLTGPNCDRCMSGYITQPVPSSVPGVFVTECTAGCSAVGNCSSRGVCSLPEVCTCFTGFFSDSCARTTACLFECTGKEFTDCEAVRCFPSSKPGMHIRSALCPFGCRHGTCSRTTRTCACDTGWLGEDCSSPSCGGGLQCFGHGVCSEPDVCLCTEGWDGINCESSACGVETTCHGCRRRGGCGWCALTGECLPAALQGGAYSPAKVGHPCTLQKAFFKQSECYIGFVDADDFHDTITTVSYLNCSAVCLSDSGKPCSHCMRTVDPQTIRVRPDAPKSFRHLLQLPTPAPTQPASKTVSLTLTGSVSRTESVSPTITETPVRTCTEMYSLPWVPDALAANYACACRLERENKRDLRWDCMQQFLSLNLVLNQTLREEAVAKKTEYAAVSAALSKQIPCCESESRCCNSTLLNQLESRTLAYVEWYVAIIVPIHRKAYEQARVECGCESSCVNHQRDAIWLVLSQYVVPCVVGSVSSVLLHPCQLSLEHKVKEALPQPYAHAECPLGTSMQQQVRPHMTYADDVLLASTQPNAPSCVHWVVDPDMTSDLALWGCCNAAMACYSDCTKPVVGCTDTLLQCVLGLYSCHALLGVQQRVSEIREESLGRLTYNTLRTTIHSKAVRDTACPCIPDTAAAPIAKGFEVGSTRICFEGWLYNEAAGTCDTPACDCSGQGICVEDQHQTTSCRCATGYTGRYCQTPTWGDASAFGLGHVVTWDGTWFRHLGCGTYTMLRARSRSGKPFLTEASKAYLPWRGVSIIDAVSLQHNSVKVDVFVRQNLSCAQAFAAAPPGAAAPCPRPAIHVLVNGMPFSSAGLSWQHRVFDNEAGGGFPESHTAVYTAEMFHETVIFIRDSSVRAKVAVVWAEPLQLFYIDLLLAVEIQHFDQREGMFASLDGIPGNDITGHYPEGGPLKNVMADYHAFGERWRTTSGSTVPIYSAGSLSPTFALPPSHTYFVEGTTQAIPLCDAQPEPFCMPCRMDFALLRDAAATSEFMLNQRHCSSDRVSGCFLGGACYAPGKCLCPSPRNASASCELPEVEAAVRFAAPAATEACAALSHCSHRGACVAGGGTAPDRCECSAGWGSDMCATPLCAEHCVQGYCGERPDGTAGCVCYPGFSGTACSDVQHCPTLWECNGHGACTDTGGCACHTGWGGDVCDVPQELPPGSCAPLMGGRWCTMPRCDCSGHGACMEEGGLPRCQCINNWYTATCQVYCVAEVTCTGHGVCSSEGLCECTSPYRTAQCDIVDPTINTQYTLRVTTRPTRHQQGKALNTIVTINGGSAIPHGFVLRWTSTPEGLFPPTSENQPSFEVSGSAFVCVSKVSIGVRDYLRTCSYRIQAELYIGVSVLSYDYIDVEIDRAPTFSHGMSVSGGTEIGGALMLRELTSLVTLDAGLWITPSPPNLYRFEVSMGSQQLPLAVNNSFEFQMDSKVQVPAPLMPCTIRTLNVSLEFYVSVKSSNGAVARMRLNITQPMLLQRVPRPEITGFLQALPQGPGHPAAVAAALFLPQRLPPAEWPWPTLEAILASMLSVMHPAGYSRSIRHTPVEMRVVLLAALVELIRMMHYPDETPACGSLVAAEAAVLNATRYEGRIQTAQAVLDAVMQSEMSNQTTLSTALSVGMLNSVAQHPVVSKKLSMYHEILARASGDVSADTVTSSVQTASAESSHRVDDVLVYTLANYPQVGKEIVVATIDPGSSRSFIVLDEASVTPNATAANLTYLNVLLESSILHAAARDPITKEPLSVVDTADSQNPIAYITFTLSREIDYTRSYNCVYWEGQWLGGAQAGVGAILPVLQLRLPISTGGVMTTTYACPVSHFSMFAVAFIQPLAVVRPSTPVPPTALPETAPPRRGVDYSVVPVVTSSNNTTTIVLASLGSAAGLCVIFVVVQFVRFRRRKKAAADMGKRKSHRRSTWMEVRQSLDLRGKISRSKFIKKQEKAKQRASHIRSEVSRNARAGEVATRQRAMKAMQEREADKEAHMGLPDQPEDVLQDDYLAQREMDVIEKAVKLEDLPKMNPARTVGTSVFVYPVQGDSESEEEEDEEGYLDQIHLDVEDADADGRTLKKGNRRRTVAKEHAVPYVDNPETVFPVLPRSQPNGPE